MVGALLISLIVIGAFVAFRAINRDELEVEPEAVDYLETVRALQDEGVTVVYPPSLPEGWIATSVDFQPGQRPAWGLGLLTDDEKFVGIRQEDTPLEDMLDTYVDENASEAATTRISSDVAQSWRQFEDAGGDHAFAAQLDDQWVLVYGSADPADLQAFVERLTTEPLEG
jgi:hypothetical protein